MKKYLLLLLLFPYLTGAHAQSIDAGPDTVACPGSNITLTATVTGGVSGTYTISSIPYNPFSYTTGTMVSLSDESVSGALNIGFTFSYMGNNYTQFYICSNGWVGFTNQFASWTINPLPDPSMPVNCIMGAFHDLNPSAGGAITYFTTGTAPNRTLVVNWNQVPLYSCNTFVTQQIVLYETSNWIENYFLSKPICTSWSNGNSIQGIHNSTGTVAYTVPGRNATQWTANNEGWRYSPGTSSSFGPVTWYDASGNNIGTGNSITTAFTGSTYYTAQVTELSTGTVYTDIVNVASGIPGLSISVTHPSCAGNSNGSATVITSGGPYTYSWSTGQTTSTITGLAPGSYTVTVTGAGGCSETAVATISSSTQLTVYASQYGESCAGCNNGIAYSNPAGGTPPYTYNWQPGNYNTQDVYNVSPGTYTVCITDANNCTICDSTAVYSFGVGMEEADGDIAFAIHPNPVSNGKAVFIFDLTKPQDAEIAVINSLGSEVYGNSIHVNGSSRYELDTRGFAKGIYFIRVRSNNGIAVRRLVIQ